MRERDRGKGCGGGGGGGEEQRQQEEEEKGARAAARVSIPAAVRRTIQNIKEIAGNHTDEEVYAALRECDMDPNETTQKLLHQDTFHEVKRNGDKTKEGNKESADPRRRPGTQGRGGKGGRGDYLACQSSNSSDSTRRNSLAGKENDLNTRMDKYSSSSAVNPITAMKAATSVSLSGGLSYGPSQTPAPMANFFLSVSHVPSSDSKGPADLKSTLDEVVLGLGSHVSQTSTLPPPSKPGVCTCVSDSVLTPSLEAHSQCEIIANKHASKSQRAAGLVSDDVSAVPKGSRPSSRYSSHSQQPGGSQKAVPNKEWKPKPTNKPTQAENVTHDDVPVTVKDAPQSVLTSTSIHKEDISSDMDKKFSDLQLADKEHVMIPDHLQVTESERYRISFGSFGTIDEYTTGFPNDHGNEKISMPPEYESSQEVVEAVEEPASSSYHGASSTVEAAAEPGQQQLTAEIAESDQSKGTAVPHVPQDLAQNSYSSYALAPQPQGNQIPLLETSEYQVQQPNDFIANYYTYRPIADADGHLSPFAAPGAVAESGNMSVLPTQTGQTQEIEHRQQNISRETVLEDLPESVIINEILVRLPAEDILRCRAVCKSWHHATSTHDFLLAHHLHQPSLPVIDLIKSEGRLFYRQLAVCFDASPCAASRKLSKQTILSYPTPGPYSDNLVIHGACDGLLVVSYREGDFDVCNPFTRQHAPLSLLHDRKYGIPVTEIRIAGFYQHHASKEYRVLYSIWRGSFTSMVAFHVLAVGCNKSRPIEEPPLQQGLLDGLTCSKNAPVLNGVNLHWILARSPGKDFRSIIVFDTEVERFRWMCSPACKHIWMSLLGLDGALAACSSIYGIVIDIYVMLDYNTEVWTPTYKINLSALQASPQLDLPSCSLRKIARFNNSELLIELPGVILHCGLDGKFLGKMECDEEGGDRMHITSFRFQQSIVPLPFFGMREDYGDSLELEDKEDDDYYPESHW